MLQAAEWDATDADVQVVLGVLYNVSRNFEGAVEAFQAASAARPDDYSLWNKLGATMANSQRSDEALPAYQHGRSGLTSTPTTTHPTPHHHSIDPPPQRPIASTSHRPLATPPRCHPATPSALELKPRYARGWLNLGISHANLMGNKAAVRCYLHALDLNPSATHIWTYVPMALSSMERYDLVKFAATMDVDVS